MKKPYVDVWFVPTGKGQEQGWIEERMTTDVTEWEADNYIKLVTAEDGPEASEIRWFEKRPTVHFNQLRPGELERLALVMEECGEVIQAIGKVMRHGYNSCHPTTYRENREILERELGDLAFAMDLLAERDLRYDNVQRAAYDKADRVQQFLHHTDIG